MLCPACLGDGCRECKKGFIRQHRRPAALLSEEGQDLFQAYRWLKTYGMLPAPGALIEQAAAFLDAVDFCDSVHRAYGRARERMNAETAKVQASLQKMLGKHAGR